MKVILIRVHNAEVLVDNAVISSIQRGIVLFVGIEKGDTLDSLTTLADKVTGLRIFENEQGKLHYSVKEKNYQILCISNFTLCASTEKGRRPSFDNSMDRQGANELFEKFVSLIRNKEIAVSSGVFGAHMDIRLMLDGPVNIVLSA